MNWNFKCWDTTNELGPEQMERQSSRGNRNKPTCSTQSTVSRVQTGETTNYHSNSKITLTIENRYGMIINSLNNIQDEKFLAKKLCFQLNASKLTANKHYGQCPTFYAKT
ncbi:Hypothetical_protein [Hexamita inflata]|uniref:Hypothetical_protein n=1 Tax=Hexamita inflata TaxID=28002 RepID=A0AA86NFF7_9EUKA|nr:Hypothetical protein HINF_LOCUS5783 [Hexamita inflata]